MARARLTAMQAHHCSSEGALSSLEEAIGDKEKQMAQLREQRDRAEQEKQEERELHEREIAEYKMKIHALESEVGSLFSVSKSPYIFLFQVAKSNASLSSLLFVVNARKIVIIFAILFVTF